MFPIPLMTSEKLIGSDCPTNTLVPDNISATLHHEMFLEIR